MNLEHVYLVCKHKNMLKNLTFRNPGPSFTPRMLWFEYPNQSLDIVTALVHGIFSSF